MGNSNSHTDAPEHILSSPPYDQYPKSVIIDHIKSATRKKYIIDDSNFDKGILGVELYSQNILGMSIELYQSLEKFCREYIPPIKQQPFKKYIKVEFSCESLRKVAYNNPNVITFNENTISYMSEQIKVTKSFPTFMVTLSEYDTSFPEALEKRDMVGISKSLLQNIPKYHKTRLINSFNDCFQNNNVELISKYSLGAASFTYKEAKNGPKDDVNSYRKIIALPNVVSHFHRIYAIRLYNHLKNNNILDDSIQKGCVPGQKAPLLQQIIKVKTVLNDANFYKKTAAIMFIDIADAFGSINRDSISYILGKYKVDNNFIQYINTFYSNFEYYVRNKEITMENIKWQDGLVQGCPLSPILFITVMNYVLTFLDKKYREKYGYKYTGKDTRLFLTAYVDDICISVENVDNLNEIYTDLVEILGNIGMKINPSKSGIMLINYPPQKIAQVNIDNIPIVTEYKYLGADIRSNGNHIVYQRFCSELTAKLEYLNTRLASDESKCHNLHKFIIPWVTRQMANMYDLGSVEKNNVLTIIDGYQKKWNDNAICDIFPNIQEIFEQSNDNVLSTFGYEDLNINPDNSALDSEFAKYIPRKYQHNYKDIENDAIPIEQLVQKD